MWAGNSHFSPNLIFHRTSLLYNFAYVTQNAYFCLRYRYKEEILLDSENQAKMKILHTADWHLGKKLEGYPRLEEQKLVLDEICQIADKQKAEVVIVAGDLYDHFTPSNDATELFYKTFKRLSNHGKRAVIAIAGNHDSPERIEAPHPLAKECGIIFVGFPNTIVQPFKLDSGLEVLQSEEGFIELKLPNNPIPLRLLLTPYANELRLKKFLNDDEQGTELRLLLKNKWQTLADQYCDKKGINLLIAHLFFMEKGKAFEEEPEGEKPIMIGGATAIHTVDVPKQIQYTALGHLHRYQDLGGGKAPVVYSSSPLAYSFAEANQTKYVVMLELEAGKKAKFEKIALTSGKPLLRQSVESIEEAVEWLNEHQDAWVELTVISDDFLDGQQLKQLHAAHSGIVKIIPQLTIDLETQSDIIQNLDLSQSMDELFKQYFKYKHGQEPSEELIALFKEMKGITPPP